MVTRNIQTYEIDTMDISLKNDKISISEEEPISVSFNGFVEDEEICYLYIYCDLSLVEENKNISIPFYYSEDSKNNAILSDVKSDDKNENIFYTKMFLIPENIYDGINSYIIEKEIRLFPTVLSGGTECIKTGKYLLHTYILGYALDKRYYKYEEDFYIEVTE